jgi:hypothetical protein
MVGQRARRQHSTAQHKSNPNKGEAASNERTTRNQNEMRQEKKNLRREKPVNRNIRMVG